jgi:hypothetical protein
MNRLKAHDSLLTSFTNLDLYKQSLENNFSAEFNQSDMFMNGS